MLQEYFISYEMRTFLDGSVMGTGSCLFSFEDGCSVHDSINQKLEALTDRVNEASTVKLVVHIVVFTKL